MITFLLIVGIFIAYQLGRSVQRQEDADALMKHFGMKKK